MVAEFPYQIDSIGFRSSKFRDQDISVSSVSCSSNHCSTILTRTIIKPSEKTSSSKIEPAPVFYSADKSLIDRKLSFFTERSSISPPGSLMRRRRPTPLSPIRSFTALQQFSVHAHDNSTLTADQVRLFRATHI